MASFFCVMIIINRIIIIVVWSGRQRAKPPDDWFVGWVNGAWFIDKNLHRIIVDDDDELLIIESLHYESPCTLVWCAALIYCFVLYFFKISSMSCRVSSCVVCFIVVVCSWIATKKMSELYVIFRITKKMLVVVWRWCWWIIIIIIKAHNSHCTP